MSILISEQIPAKASVSFRIKPPIRRVDSFRKCFILGVSCDACLKGNFRGRRYKCLMCFDYDLCAQCYEQGATSTRHNTDHAMQCILTRADFGTDL